MIRDMDLLIAALLVSGALLLLLETVLPGLVAGIAGLGCLAAGVVVAYNRFGFDTGNLVFLSVLAALIVGTVAWLKYFPTSPMARPFISNRTIGNVDAEKPELLNQTGIAHTALRPSGTAIIAGQRVDVVTEGSMIAPGTPVKVVAIEGLRVVVRAV